ncbi:MAG: hypothetical protein Q8930_19025 [Bacillota bacterium]|nr:hypothetical protein [Bacillota bacterium]
MYINDFRDYNGDDCIIYDPGQINELETQDLPLECPYRQLIPSSLYRQQVQGPPSSPPPGFTPSEPQAQQFGATSYAVDQGAISPCVFRFIYIWPRRGSGFWAWLTYVGRRSVSGFRWERGAWRYFGMSLRDIRSFQCF